MICFSQTQADRDAFERAKPADLESLAADATSYAGKVVEKPWGEEREVRGTSEFSCWRLAIAVGQETSMHCHWRKTTILEVQSGEVELQTLSGVRRLGQGDCVLIEPGVFHRTRAPQGAVVIEVEWPPNRRDLVRLSDIYGRQGRGYAD